MQNECFTIELNKKYKGVLKIFEAMASYSTLLLSPVSSPYFLDSSCGLISQVISHKQVVV